MRITERDPEEPTAHVVQAIGTIIRPENSRHLYEDTISILYSLLIAALDATLSTAERDRFSKLLAAAREDLEVCGIGAEHA